MKTPSTHRIRRALISVSDKTGVVDFARRLSERGIEIISTGGTAKTLVEAGIGTRSVSDVTGFEEILGGRVKTLHPAIHGGLLGVLDDPDHVRQMEAHMIQSIDLVAVNLYPFEETLAAEGGAAHETIIENIDVGGPAMIRASAKNYRWTAIVTNPERYDEIIARMDGGGGALEEGFRRQLAREAFAHTAYYDSVIAAYFERLERENAVRDSKSNSGNDSERRPAPAIATLGLRRELELRYGENPHQTAVLYKQPGAPLSYGDIFGYLHGKELSYNNLLDIDAAAKLALEFVSAQYPATAVIIKHTNPCGVASAESLAEAYRNAYACDTTSAFGGIIAVTRELDEETATAIDEIFTEVLIAPSYSPAALELLQRKKNRRLMTVRFDALAAALENVEYKTIAGGILAQTADRALWREESLRVATERQPSPEERAAMEYAWRIAKHVKSNAVVYAAPDRALAIGAGQMSRVDSAAVAARKAAAAGLSLAGSAVASDAFFPFADGLLETVNAGATAVIQPGGSVRDAEVIQAANERGVAMIFTDMRHFRH
jgi:phosphoribosylaminoimidazolecarboxamide formyltransferase/IMP cyclohydrolase